MNDDKVSQSAPRPLLRLKAGAPSRLSTYAIWRHGYRAPKVRHATLERAMAELDRLALANPAGIFDVYELKPIARRVGK